jgi:hypothetical protein
MVARPSPLHEIQQTFRAPLPYVYRWLTDYTSEDLAAEKEDYQRKIIEKSRRRVIFEDLTDRKTGWEWYRSDVTLSPPDRWHAELTGNGPTWSLDYRLSAISPNQTLITIRLRIRRRPGVRGEVIPSKAEAERELRGFWKNFALSLNRDYRKVARGRARRPRRRGSP